MLYKLFQIAYSWAWTHSLGGRTLTCSPLVSHGRYLVSWTAVLALAACAGSSDRPAVAWSVVQDSTHRVATIEGLSGPEAVRYDPDLDVYFIANFNGEAAGDSNGFISRVAANDLTMTTRFMEGTPAAPLHGPRGMFVTGDTLWVADADGVHGFDRNVGTQVAFVSFTAFAPGFLNDIVQGPDGALYITDTGLSRVYRLAGRDVTIAIEDSTMLRPNGITWDEANARFLLVSWDPGNTMHAWRLGEGWVTDVGVIGNGRNDGVEIFGSRILVASQSDSALHAYADGERITFARVPGNPADIGIDTRRGRVAVPYIALDRVDIWDLPAEGAGQ